MLRFLKRQRSRPQLPRPEMPPHPTGHNLPDDEIIGDLSGIPRRDRKKRR